MSELEEGLNGILNDPQMMQKIMSMAKSLSGDAPAPKQEALPGIDLGTMQKIASFASQSGIDKDQQTLLVALRPYLARERIAKLEKAMRAAKMAKLAGGFLGQKGAAL